MGLGKTIAHLPHIELEWIIGFPRRELGCMRAAILIRAESSAEGESYAQPLMHGTLWLEFYSNLKICKIDSRSGGGNLVRNERLRVPLNQEIVVKCILRKHQKTGVVHINTLTRCAILF